MGIHDEPPSEAARAEALRRRLAEADDRADSASSHDSAVHYDAPAGGGGGAPLSTSILSQRVASPVPGAGGGTADTRAFTLTGAEASPDGMVVTARFSRNVDGLSAEATDRFSISRNIGIGGVSAQGNAVVIVLSRRVTPGVEYTLTVSPGLLASDGSTTLSGTRTATFSIAGFRFLRAYASDSRRFVTLEFSEAVVPTSVTDPGQRFVMHRLEGGSWVDYAWGTVATASASTVTLQLTAALAEDTTYSITINNHYADNSVPLMGGDPPIPMGGQIYQTFSTADDSLPPQGFRVVRVFPRLNRREVEVEFSEPVSSLSARNPGSPSKFSISPSAGTPQVTANGSELVVLTFPQRLEYQTEYELRIRRVLLSAGGADLPVTPGLEHTSVHFSTGERPTFAVVSVRAAPAGGVDSPSQSAIIVVFSSEPLESEAERAANWSADGLTLGTPAVVNDVEVHIPIDAVTPGRSNNSYTLVISAMVVSTDNIALPAGERMHSFAIGPLLNLQSVRYIDGEFVITWSAQPGPVTREGFMVIPHSGNLGSPRVPIPEPDGTGVTSVRRSGNSIHITPSVDTVPGTRWDIIWSRSLRGQEGGGLRGGRTFFTSIVPGSVTPAFMIDDAQGEGGVNVGAGLGSVVISFTDRVDPSTGEVVANYFPQTASGGTASGTTPVVTAAAVSGRTVTLTFRDALVAGARYAIRVLRSVTSTRMQSLTGDDTAGEFTAGFQPLTVLSVELDGTRAIVTFSHAISTSTPRSRFAVSTRRTDVPTPSVTGVSVSGAVATVTMANIRAGTAYTFNVLDGVQSSVSGIRPLADDHIVTLNSPETEPLTLRPGNFVTFTAPRTVTITFTRHLQRSSLVGLIYNIATDFGVTSVVASRSGEYGVATVTLNRDPGPGTHELGISDQLASSDGTARYSGPETIEFTVTSTSPYTFDAEVVFYTDRQIIDITFSGVLTRRTKQRIRSLVQIEALTPRRRTITWIAYGLHDIDGLFDDGNEPGSYLSVIIPRTSSRLRVTLSRAITFDAPGSPALRGTRTFEG